MMLIKNIKNKIVRNEGFGTIEAVILIAILIGLAVIFRNNIIDFVEMIFESIFEDAEEFMNTSMLGLFYSGGR